MSEWISVENELPKDGDEVLIFNSHDNAHISIGYMKNSLFFDLIDFTMNPIEVTHWMTLPDKPK